MLKTHEILNKSILLWKNPENKSEPTTFYCKTRHFIVAIKIIFPWSLVEELNLCLSKEQWAMGRKEGWRRTKFSGAKHPVHNALYSGGLCSWHDNKTESLSGHWREVTPFIYFRKKVWEYVDISLLHYMGTSFSLALNVQYS